MLPRHHPDRVQITFDDHRLVATLARHLGLPQLLRKRLDLGDAPGRANTGDKMMTLVASALVGGVVKAPSTPRFREGRLWEPSCAASGGGMSANWTG